MRSLPALGVAVAMLSACGVSGLSFVKDERITIVSPEERSSVTLPVTVRWTVDDFDGSFGVFVDRAPQPPGKTLAWLARDDEVCAATPGCPDEAYLAQRDAFHITDTELTIEELPELTRGEQREFHEVIIVLLDDDGARIGESAFSVEFELEREDD